MFCTECGTKLVEVAKFCSECGAPVKPLPQQSTKPFWQRPVEVGQRGEDAVLTANRAAEETVVTAANKAEEIADTSEKKAEAVFEAGEEKAEAVIAAAELKAAEVFGAAEEKVEEIIESAEVKSSNAADAVVKLVAEAAAVVENKETEVFEAADNKAEEDANKAEDATVQAAEIKPKEPDYTKLKTEELAKKYEDAEPAAAASEPAADKGTEIKESLKNAGEDAKKAAKAVAAGVGSAVDSLQLDSMQKILMVLAGTSFLCLVISFTSVNWLMRVLLIISAACLTFFTAKKYELPNTALTLPLALTSIGILFSWVIQFVINLLRRRGISIALDTTLYRLILIAAVVMLLMVCFGQDKKNRSMLNILTALFACLSVYHLYNLVKYIKAGRVTLMYNLGLMLFYAVYVLLANRFAKKIPSSSGSYEPPLSKTVDVHKKEAKATHYTYTGTRPMAPDPAPEKVYTAEEKEYKAMPQENYKPSEDKGLQSVPGDYIFCTRCGTRLPKDAVFCSKCGYPVSNPINPPA